MYYIYEKSSTYIMGKTGSDGVTRPDHRKSYATLGAAKAALTRITKAENLLPTDPNYAEFRYGIAASAFFHQNIEKSRTTTNMMSGKPIVEPVNTPGYMSPSSEAYWSM
jgi:hypothetical protein